MSGMLFLPSMFKNLLWQSISPRNTRPGKYIVTYFYVSSETAAFCPIDVKIHSLCLKTMKTGTKVINKTNLPLFKYTPHSFKLFAPYACETRVSNAPLNPITNARPTTF